MPWGKDDAPRFNSATQGNDHLKEVWSSAANAALKKYRDEGRAIRVANSAVSKAKQKS